MLAVSTLCRNTNRGSLASVKLGDANIYQCRLRLCGESSRDGAHDITPLIKQLGPDCDWSKCHRIDDAPSTLLMKRAADDGPLGDTAEFKQAERDFLERWQTLPPNHYRGVFHARYHEPIRNLNLPKGMTSEWSKCTDEEIKSVIQPYMADGGWGVEEGEDWEMPQMWEITFGSVYSPPFKAFEIIVDETINLFQAYLAFEDVSMGNCGRWECYTGGEETDAEFCSAAKAIETEFIQYTNDDVESVKLGELLATDGLPKSEWQLVEDIWTEIHGPDELEDRIKYRRATKSMWKWIPVNKRFKNSQ